MGQGSLVLDLVSFGYSERIDELCTWVQFLFILSYGQYDLTDNK